jgi:CRISPR/Cas system-associated exonuclease Cas4 (RecB family)
MKFSMDSMDVWLAVDLFTEKDGIFIITDWKTGSEGYDDIDENMQLGLYILWAHMTKNTPLEKLKGELVYLKTANTLTTSRSLEQIQALRDYIKADSAEMLAVKGEKDFPASPGRKCKGCNFLQLCEEGKSCTSH